MLSFFPSLYKDELLYSALARFHQRSGSNSYKRTLLTLFGNYTSSAITDFPGRLNALCLNIGGGVYNPEKIINNHTLLPYYKPFIEEELVMKITEQMTFKDSGSIFLSVGGAASKVKGPDYFRFCLNCFNQEQDLYGEAYWHRTHQLPGVMVCPIHKEFLFVSDVPFRNQPNRQSLLTLDKKNVESSIRINHPPHLFDSLLFIAEKSEQLLNDTEILQGWKCMREYYTSQLKEKGYITVSKRIRMRELIDDFFRELSSELLEISYSNFDKNNEDTWFHKVLRKPRSACHPLRHILILYFLNDEMLKNKSKSNYKDPFGEGPWPCLNKAAAHYRENIIQRCIITKDSKTSCPVGTFSCDKCQFTYSRKGPDSSEEEKYKIGRIKIFGDVWKEKLFQLSLGGSYSIRKIASILGVDSKTVKKYINVTNDDENDNLRCIQLKKEKYKEKFIELKTNNPTASRNQLRTFDSALYMWLYRYEKKWLLENLPQPQPRRKNSYQYKVDWNKRDEEYSLFIIREAINIITERSLIRVTKTRILNRLDKQTMIGNNLINLPLCRIVLEEVTESVEEFQIRRVRYNAEQLRSQHKSFTKSMLIRASAIKGKVSERVNEVILEELN